MGTLAVRGRALLGVLMRGRERADLLWRDLLILPDDLRLPLALDGSVMGDWGGAAPLRLRFELPKPSGLPPGVPGVMSWLRVRSLFLSPGRSNRMPSSSWRGKTRGVRWGVTASVGETGRWAVPRSIRLCSLGVPRQPA